MNNKILNFSCIFFLGIFCLIRPYQAFGFSILQNATKDCNHYTYLQVIQYAAKTTLNIKEYNWFLNFIIQLDTENTVNISMKKLQRYRILRYKILMIELDYIAINCQNQRPGVSETLEEKIINLHSNLDHALAFFERLASKKYHDRLKRKRKKPT